MKDKHRQAEAVNARAILASLNLNGKQDFHTLTAAQVDGIIQAADRARYQKPRNANGSRARYFFQRLQRLAGHA